MSERARGRDVAESRQSGGLHSRERSVLRTDNSRKPRDDKQLTANVLVMPQVSPTCHEDEKADVPCLLQTDIVDALGDRQQHVGNIHGNEDTYADLGQVDEVRSADEPGSDDVMEDQFDEVLSRRFLYKT